MTLATNLGKQRADTMFQTEIQGDSSFLAFFLQEVGMVLSSALWGALCGNVLAHLTGPSPAGRLVEALGTIALGLTPTFLVGVLFGSRFPHFAYSGRWVWLLPTALFLIALLSSALDSMLGQELSDLLFPPDDPEAMWALAFLSYPTLGCIGYSLGICFYSRTKNS